MAIRYSVHTNTLKNAKTGEDKKSVWVSVKSRSNYRMEDLVRELSGGSPAKKGELMSAFIRIAACIEEKLKDGHSVTIDGYGTFQLTVQVKEGKENSDFRAESVELKNVVFNATRQAKKRINAAGFERFNEDIHPRR